ncbi:MAG: DNA-directed RNA polymerase subunit omega [Desulfobulbaceae bacterium]|jgi:DNA-directed RNA polymerase subunit omega|nr:DNA-directed RNA polymerase subunit omega [Desulfobulbaceae bacterium]
MARITVEDCLKVIGDSNRFNLIHLAVQRIKQHRQGEPYLIEGKNKEVVMTLREIASGKVTMENIDSIAAVSDETALPEEPVAVNDNPA